MDGHNAKKAQGWLHFMQLHVPAVRIDQAHDVDKRPHVVEAREAADAERARREAERIGKKG